MKANTKLVTQPDVIEKYNAFPVDVKEKIFRLRDWLIDVSESLEDVTRIEESLKWGEPSYRSNIGSTIRFYWSEKRPEIIGMYCQCTSLLIPSIKNTFGNAFLYDGNRGVLLDKNGLWDEEKIKQIMIAALRYHKVKHLLDLNLVSEL